VTGVNDARSTESVDGSGVHVAVVDSGVAATHPDLDVANNYQWSGNPLGSPTFWVPAHDLDTDELGHGTHCSGTIAGQGETDGGMAPGAALTGYSTGAAVSVLKSAAAYDHLLANHADTVDVVSNSYGASSADDFDPNGPLNVGTRTAYDRGLVSVFAAGNSGPSQDTLNDYAKAPWVLGVAATTDAKNVTGFSSRGRKGGQHDRLAALDANEGIYRPGVAAPGNLVDSTMSPGDPLQATAPDADPLYAAISGTSMACPAVSGIAALMLDAAGGDADPLDIIETIEATADDEGFAPFETGAGFVDADGAVARAADRNWA
jgi:serine protease AprX